MTVNLSYFAGAGWQFFDDNGNPLSGGKLYTYLAGTTTPAVTYTSITGLTANANPIVLDAAGRPTQQVWLTSGVSYKFVVKTSTEVTIRTYDNLCSVNDFSTFANTSDPALGDALVGFRQSNASGNLTGSVAKTVHQKFQEIVSVKDFGAVGDGTTDDSAAFQAAFNYANLQGGGVVYMPPGVYRKADTANNIWTMYSNTTLRGDGDCSVIFFDDKPSVSRSNNDMLTCSNTNNINFENFKILGTALTYLSSTNQKQCLTGQFIDQLRMVNVTISGVRFMATAFDNVKNGYFSGNYLEYVVRDGIRCTNSFNVIVTGNRLKSVADDCVVLTSSDSATLVGSGFIISNNTFEACQGIKILGAKTAVISNNVFKRMLRAAIYINIPNSGTTGNTPQFSLNITDNVINDTFTTLGINFQILVTQNIGMSPGGLSTQPGINSNPLPYTYLNDLTTGTPVVINQFGININNNIIARTLGNVAAYSSYGYGLLFDRTPTVSFTDPAIVNTTFGGHGIKVSSPIVGLQICNNNISGISPGFSGILLDSNTATNIQDYSDVLISSNIIFNVAGSGISGLNTGSGVNAKQIYIINNILDLDPYFINSTHNANNTWTTSGSCVALNFTTIANLIINGNVIKNAGKTGILLNNCLTTTPNIVYSDYVGAGDNAGNKGVRWIPEASRNSIIKIDGDPTSATYGQTVSVPYTYSFSIPTTGSYVADTFVYSANPTVLGTAGSQYIITGWVRLTTGSAHVLNTDWVETRSLTGT
jgi:hypothetical protein